jgi:hypothetical protein
VIVPNAARRGDIFEVFYGLMSCSLEQRIGERNEYGCCTVHNHEPSQDQATRGLQASVFQTEHSAQSEPTGLHLIRCEHTCSRTTKITLPTFGRSVNVGSALQPLG